MLICGTLNPPACLLFYFVRCFREFPFALGLAFFAASAHASPPTICTLTFNSANESAALRGAYPGANFVELLPKDRNSDWFGRACRSGIRCDILLMSGHFGGVFFGEKKSETLDLDAMEDAGCRNECPGILSAKRVYLMACNTLAAKTPDHRTIDEYVRVLTNDGFPHAFAESLASARYSGFGLSIAERMAIAFAGSTLVSGFASTAPVGAIAGPMLGRGLRANPADPDAGLASAFAGSSYRTMRPGREIDADDRRIACGMRAQNSEDRVVAFRSAFGRPRRFLDSLLEKSANADLRRAWEVDSGNSRRTAEIRELLERVFRESRGTAATRFQILKLKRALGFLKEPEYLAGTGELLESVLRAGLDFDATDEACSIAGEAPGAGVPESRLSDLRAAERPYYARLAGCATTVGTESRAALRNWSHAPGELGREALRSMTGRWSDTERRTQATAVPRGGRARYEVLASLGLPDDPLPVSLRACYSSVDFLPTGRSDEDARWNCFERSKAELRSLSACVAATASFRTETGLGPDWYCMDHFRSDLGLAACARLAAPIASDEKADDLLATCSDRLRADHVLGKSECLGFARALRIPGNRIKQNWNCTHEVHST